MQHSDALNAVLPYAFGNELAWLREIELPENAEVVMIGAGPGVMAMALFESNNTFHLTVIDILTCSYVQSHLTGMGVEIKPHSFIVADSKAVEWNTPIDFLLVDGDHSYAGVQGDIEHWWKYVKPGGLVFFHDVIDLEQNGTNGVETAVEYAMTFGNCEADLIAAPGISEVYRKR